MERVERQKGEERRYRKRRGGDRRVRNGDRERGEDQEREAIETGKEIDRMERQRGRGEGIYKKRKWTDRCVEYIKGEQKRDREIG